jgi:hypothetical protein
MKFNEDNKDITIACYYFPNYHIDVRNEKVHGEGWTEWELVKTASPRFGGHYQPKEPMWGYCDEADPAVMEMKIDAAADHGIDVFLFDWYWYNDGPFLQRCLDEGFLGASNSSRLKFAIMWANHDWYNIHPTTRDFVRNWKPEGDNGIKNLLYPGKVTEDTFDYLTDVLINEYFSRDNYWKIDGCPYFSIYELNMFIQSFGGMDGAKRQIDKFREKTVKAGYDGLNLNAVIFAKTILPGEVALPVESVIDQLGFDSCTSYVWIHHIEMEPFPRIDYISAMNDYIRRWDSIAASIDLPYYPNITMGWDSSPRTDQDDIFEDIGYPYTGVLYDNTPEKFRQALECIKAGMLKHGQNIMNINCWNEWTEGSYLEPDLRYGMKYLEAIRDVFGVRNKIRKFDVEEVLI